jgi:NAD+ kinase
LLSKLKNKEYTVENRMMLSVEIYENGNKVNEFLALNDAVITSGFISRIVDISVSVGRDAINYLADGLIVSTPTGSTAYSMSAGGPIIDPLTENICITPICSHSLSAKPILLGANNKITLKSFSKKRTEIYLTVDGRKVANIKPYTEIKITKSDKMAQLIRLNDRSFYKTLSIKFNDSRSF